MDADDPFALGLESKRSLSCCCRCCDEDLGDGVDWWLDGDIDSKRFSNFNENCFEFGNVCCCSVDINRENVGGLGERDSSWW